MPDTDEAKNISKPDPNPSDVLETKDSGPKESSSGTGPKKGGEQMVFILLISLFVVTVLLVSLFFTDFSLPKSRSTTVDAPVSLSDEGKNPFDVEVPNPFGSGEDYTNPFAFSEESQEYENPFEDSQ